MKTVTFSNGKTIPALGIGTWYLGENRRRRAEEIEAIRYGLDYGLKLIDTAEMYGDGLSEELVGEAIAPYKRENLFLVSKVLPSHANKRNLERALDNSLFRMGVDYLDLYLYHWRGGTPLRETINELEKMKFKGKIKAWGVSNFDTADMKELLALPYGRNCRVNQVLYNLGERGIEYSLKPLCDKNKILTMAYCPLAQAGRIQKNLLANPVVKSVAESLGISAYQLLIAFLLTQENVIIIPRTGKIEHMKDNCMSAEIHLPKEVLKKLDQEFPPPTHQVPLAIQ